MFTEQPRLALTRRHLDAADLAAVANALSRPTPETEQAVDAFETALRHRLDAPHVVTTAGIGSALRLAIKALDLSAGDAIILPVLTPQPLLDALAWGGVTPIFADVDGETGLMGPAQAEAAADGVERIKAVMPVHLTGQVADPIGFASLSRDRGWRLIEAAGQGLGGSYFGGGAERPVGCAAHADVVIVSFHADDVITCGSGEALSTADDALAIRLRQLRDRGEPGLLPPCPLDEVSAALGRSQLGKLRDVMLRRREIVAAYDAGLSRFAPALKPLERTHFMSRPGWSRFAIMIDEAALGKSRDQVIAYLDGRAIDAAPLVSTPSDGFPGAARFAASALAVPIYPGLGATDQQWILETLRDVVLY